MECLQSVLINLNNLVNPVSVLDHDDDMFIAWSSGKIPDFNISTHQL